MKILICTDGSPHADQAARLAATIAANCNAEATLFGVVEESGNADAILDALRRGRQRFEEKKVHAEVISITGQALDEIVKRTESTPYDLVVIGAARKANGGMFWWSSKAYSIIKRINPPVLVVMERIVTFKRVLVCSGGRKDLAKALPITNELIRGFGAGVTLLHVMPEPPAMFDDLRREELDAAALMESKSQLGRNLRDQKAALESAGIAVEVKLRLGPVRDQIIEEIESGNYDLVVTGSAPRQGGLHTYVLGNVTREIVNQANCAVLVVRTSVGRRAISQRLSGWLAGGKTKPANQNSASQSGSVK